MRKLENIIGTSKLPATYKPGVNGKKSFAVIAVLTAKGFRLVKAFGELADAIGGLEMPVEITLGAYKNEAGEYVAQHYSIKGEEVAPKPLPRMTEDALQAKNKELAWEGMGLVKIKTPEGLVLVRKPLIDCMTIEGELVDKLEFILDTLGAPVVTDILKENGFLGELKFSKDFSNKYKALKNKLYLKALEQNSNV